ncbi:MAG: DNA internalization-related competence protein ComEC/Rec2 [Bacteroidetes bacterium]|nr:DNA internalization-related competence protein ComEC/Rec2 [Bacteroidota bacterium]
MEMVDKSKFFQTKPALFVAILLAIGIIISNYFNVIFIWIILIFGFLLLIILNQIIFKSIFFRNIILVLILIFSASLQHSVNKNYFSQNHISNYLNLNQEFEIIGEVANDPIEKELYYSTIINTRKLINDFDTIIVTGKTLISIPKKYTLTKKINFGDLIKIVGAIDEPSISRNPGEFNYREYLLMQGIYGIINSENNKIEVIETGNQNIFYSKIIIQSREFIKKIIEFTLQKDEAYVMRGLILGDQAMISTETKNYFINTGTIHVLAVSGSHIVLVIATFYILFGLLRIPFELKIIATIFGIIFYMLLTGSTPSVVRASIMGIVVLASQLLNRKTNLYNSLGVSVVIILLWDTRQLFDIGFQLSYAAVYGMVYFYPKIFLIYKKILPQYFFKNIILNNILLLFGITLSAQIATFPVTIFYFYKFSVISLFANLIVVPLIAIVMLISFIAIIISTISIWIGSIFIEPAGLTLKFIIYFVDMMNQVPFGVVEIYNFNYFSFIYFLLILVILASLSNILKVRKLVLFFFGIITINIWYSNFNQIQKNNLLRITTLDVGQGDAIFIQTPLNKNILLDVGLINRKSNSGEKIITPFLKRIGVSKIDYLIISHPHSDHIGGAINILNSFNVENVLGSGQKSESKIFNEFQKIAHQKNYKSLKRGEIINIEDNIRFYVLHPIIEFIDTISSNGFSEINNSSLVIKMVYGKTSFLFTGDAEIETEENLSDVYSNFLDIDYLKVAHHGSITSTSETFLNNTTPQNAVISVGKWNKFKHPSPIVINRIENFKIKHHRTDKEGAVIYESDGSKISRVI